MQNEKNQLFHEFSLARIWIIYAFSARIDLSHFRNYLHRFHSAVVSHARYVVSCSPSRSQIQMLRDSIFVRPIGRIKCKHEILEREPAF